MTNKQDDTSGVIDDSNDTNKANNDNNTDDKNKELPPEIAELVRKGVDEALQPIKAKLDDAYAKVETANREAEKARQEKQAIELKQLEAEGKHLEAYELRLKAEREARELAEAEAARVREENTNLTRDSTVKTMLSVYKFRSEKAAGMAYQEIIGSLIKNDKGEWVHKSGIAIKDFVFAFAESKDNAFLFDHKVSTGAGSSKVKGNSGEKGNSSSLFEMSQEEVLKRAAEGTLPHQRK